MAFDALTYLEAAQERVHVAVDLYNINKSYCEAHYLAGLAVECLLRAYRVRVDPNFDSRHVIQDLVNSAKFYDAIPLGRQIKTAADISEVVLRWRNDHRFRSAKNLRRWLSDQKLYRGIKGDFVKESARKITNAAVSIVSEGVLRWEK